MLHSLPKIRGEYVFGLPMRDVTFLKVGGACDIMFYPKDRDDLLSFLREKPAGLQLHILGNMSNILVKDGGLRGCAISLIQMEHELSFCDDIAKAGAGLALQIFILEASKKNISSCEKLFGIPGTIGGAVIMNAGVADFEISDALLSICCTDLDGTEISLNREALDMRYRHGGVPKDLIITGAQIRINKSKAEGPKDIIAQIQRKRLQTQPIGSATCGSTFKNPDGMKAWQLIKEAGCDNLAIGGAAVSKVHCNFLINTGNATASNFIELINIIKATVLEKTGTILKEEVVIIGEDT